jgi:hypothetical protein
MNKLTLFLSVLLFCGSFLSSSAYAANEAFGMIAESEGSAQLINGDAKTAAELGSVLKSGDKLILDANSKLTIISFADCEEMLAYGKDEIIIDKYKAHSQRFGDLKPIRRLPVCYNPQDFDAQDSGTIGGYFMRGPDNAMSELQNEADQGDMSALIALVLHDIKNKQSALARPYFERLKQKYPNSKWVKNLERHFAH